MQAMKNRASDEVHKENKYWVRARKEWREKYAIATESLREMKQKNLHSSTRRSSMEYRAMKDHATFLMCQRDHIGQGLKLTAHPWV